MFFLCHCKTNLPGGTKMKFIVGLLLVVLPLSLSAQKSSAPAAQWPRSVNVEGDLQLQLDIYQPQVESLKDNRVQAMTAFKATTKDKKEYLGTFVLEAKGTLDTKSEMVELRDFKISKMNLNAKEVDSKKLTAEIENKLNEKPARIAKKSLVDSLALTQSTSQTAMPQLKNEPPEFVFSSEPSILIMISGEPKWTPSEGAAEVERVLNSSALFLHQANTSDYYLWALGKWFTATDIQGPYKVSKSGPSSKFVMVKDKLVKAKTIDPLSGVQKNGRPIFPEGVVPKILVKTKPSELLQSTGDPQYAGIKGTSLLYMSNSPNSIFLDTTTQKFFVVIAGRWFEAKSLNGPYSYISGKNLPADFAKIPKDSPVAEVLVSVPNTPQAKQASVANQLPQTAQVPRDLKAQKVECDGKVKWSKIEGTSLSAADNCNTPLIQVESNSYYIVQNGVWFSSNTAEGPWVVAIVVPAEIYKIPPSSALYYVTYVRVYGSTNDTVIVGYTPGYKGSFVSADGTVVYGTGYTYDSYVSNNYWYPAPATYGFGVGYGWESSVGFYMGFSMGSMMYPWGWGGCCYGPTYINVDVDNYYNKWGKKTVVSGPGGSGFTSATVGQTKFVQGNRTDDLYATHGGQVYRRTDDGWERNVGPGTWDPVDKGNANRDNVQHLDQSRDARHANTLPTGRQDVAPARQQPQMQPLRGGNSRAGAGGGARGGGGFRR
jgi:hypothetical protein